MIVYQKALFVHIPKTGGSWARSLLSEHGGNDFTYPHDLPQNHVWKVFRNQLVPFCFVRHPLMFVYSLWKHWSGDENCRINNANKKLYYQWDKAVYGPIFCEAIVEGDINSTLANFTRNHPGLVSDLYRKFTCKCKYVGKYERISQDFAEFLFRINGAISPELLSDILHKERVNVSRGQDVMVARDVAVAFMAKEPACFLYDYSYLPDVVDQ